MTRLTHRGHIQAAALIVTSTHERALHTEGARASTAGRSQLVLAMRANCISHARDVLGRVSLAEQNLAAIKARLTTPGITAPGSAPLDAVVRALAAMMRLTQGLCGTSCTTPAKPNKTHPESIALLRKRLERGDIEEALRRAIALSAAAGTGERSAQSLNLSTPRSGLTIAKTRTTGESLGLGDSLYALLKTRYRDLRQAHGPRSHQMMQRSSPR